MQFICGDTWITFKPIGLREPPTKVVAPVVVDHVCTISKDNIKRAFLGLDNRVGYLYSRFEGKLRLVYMAPELEDRGLLELICRGGIYPSETSPSALIRLSSLHQHRDQVGSGHTAARAGRAGVRKNL